MKQRAWSVCLISTMTVLQSCHLLFSPSDPSGYGYVKRIGDANEVADWMLRQEKIEHLDSGVAVLQQRVDYPDHFSFDGPKLVDQLAAITNKLDSGWLLNTPQDSVITRTDIYSYMYLLLNRLSRYEPAARETLLRLEPPLGTNHRDAWERYAARSAPLEM